MNQAPTHPSGAAVKQTVSNPVVINPIKGRNYYWSIVAGFVLSAAVLVALLCIGGLEAISYFNLTTPEVAVLALLPMIARFVVSGISYIGRMFDYLIGSNRTILEMEKVPAKREHNAENILTTLFVIMGIAIAIAILLNAPIPFTSVDTYVAYCMFVPCMTGIVAGLGARTGRVIKSLLEDKLTYETYSIGAGILLGIIFVISISIQAGSVAALSMFGGPSLLIGILCIPAIISGCASGASYIGKVCDFLLTLPQFTWADLKAAATYEKGGAVLGVVLGLAIGLTLVLLGISLPFSLPLTSGVAAVFFVIGMVGALGGLFARGGFVVDVSIAKNAPQPGTATANATTRNPLLAGLKVKVDTAPALAPVLMHNPARGLSANATVTSSPGDTPTATQATEHEEIGLGALIFPGDGDAIKGITVKAPRSTNDHDYDKLRAKAQLLIASTTTESATPTLKGQSCLSLT